MELIGTINISVQNKTLKLSYKKNKIIIQNIYLTKQQGPEVSHEEVLARKLTLV